MELKDVAGAITSGTRQKSASKSLTGPTTSCSLPSAVQSAFPKTVELQVDERSNWKELEPGKEVQTTPVCWLMVFENALTGPALTLQAVAVNASTSQKLRAGDRETGLADAAAMRTKAERNPAKDFIFQRNDI